MITPCSRDKITHNGALSWENDAQECYHHCHRQSTSGGFLLARHHARHMLCTMPVARSRPHRPLIPEEVRHRPRNHLGTTKKHQATLDPTTMAALDQHRHQGGEEEQQPSCRNTRRPCAEMPLAPPSLGRHGPDGQCTEGY
jgi:hypothetical protein